MRREFCFPVPDNIEDENAAALPNPAVSGWVSLAFRAKLLPGESRNQQALSTLPELGADATIRLDVSDDELRDAFASAIGSSGLQLVIDYVWGRPVEVLLSAMTRKELATSTSETRLVQVGESAGSTISLRAAVLWSSALVILGTAGIPPRDVLVDALQKVLAHAACGDLSIDTEHVPLADVGKAWQREPQGRRLVVIPSRRTQSSSGLRVNSETVRAMRRAHERFTCITDRSAEPATGAAFDW